MSNSLRPHGLQPARLLCLWNPPGKNTGVGCHSLLQGILPTQGWNPTLPLCRQTLPSEPRREPCIDRSPSNPNQPPQSWASAHIMFSPQKYKLPGSSEDTLTGPGDPWQLCSDSICGCALHLPRNLKTDPSANGVKRLPVTGRGGGHTIQKHRAHGLEHFFSAQLFLWLQNLAVRWSTPWPL